MWLSVTLVTICACAARGLSIGSGTEGRYFRPDYSFDSEAGAWLKFNPMPMQWKDAVLRCHYEGAVLASPLDESINFALSAIVKDHGLTTASIFTGISNIYSKTEFQSVEGVPISEMCLSWSAEPSVEYPTTCIALNKNGFATTLSCSDSHPFVCYRKHGVLKLNQCGTVDPDYVLNEKTGSCYKVYNERRSWDDAFLRCVVDGAHLAVINSDEEAKILWEIRNEKVGIEGVYIGIRAWDERRDWITVQGQSLTDAGFSSWARGEPNNVGNTENCVSFLSGDEITAHGGLYNDVPCDTKLYYICEMDAM